MGGKDTLMPTFDFKEKRRVVSKTVKSSPSGVVGIPISSNSYEWWPWCTIWVLDLHCLTSSAGNCWWYLCTALKIAILVRYSGCCGNSSVPWFSTLLRIKLYWNFELNICWHRLVVFISVFFPKYGMTLGSLARWITSLTVFFHCSESILSQTFIMLKFVSFCRCFPSFVAFLISIVICLSPGFCRSESTTALFHPLGSLTTS